MDIRQTLRYLGTPIGSKSLLFGDNRFVITHATLPHSTLTKHHNILAFHKDIVLMNYLQALVLVPWVEMTL